MQKQRCRRVGRLFSEQQEMMQYSQRGSGQLARKRVLRDAIELVGCLLVVKPCFRNGMIRQSKVVLVGSVTSPRMTFWRSVIVTHSSEKIEVG
jgi:hypothetical protein